MRFEHDSTTRRDGGRQGMRCGQELASSSAEDASDLEWATTAPLGNRRRRLSLRRSLANRWQSSRKLKREEGRAFLWISLTFLKGKSERSRNERLVFFLERGEEGHSAHLHHSALFQTRSMVTHRWKMRSEERSVAREQNTIVALPSRQPHELDLPHNNTDAVRYSKQQAGEGLTIFEQHEAVLSRPRLKIELVFCRFCEDVVPHMLNDDDTHNRHALKEKERDGK